MSDNFLRVTWKSGCEDKTLCVPWVQGYLECISQWDCWNYLYLGVLCISGQ
jgi:hypothetical protein